jgi:signal transduction histidine kinase
MATEDLEDGARILGLSRKLAAIHVTGIGLLFLVVIATTFWISAEHNTLARRASEDLVGSGVKSLRTRLGSFARDYSIWDDAYDSLVIDDRDWIYRNIGNAASEIGTLDLIEFVYPPIGEPFGWQLGSPPEGEANLLPRDLLTRILRELDVPGKGDGRPDTIFANWKGDPWIFALALVRPVEGIPAGVSPEDLPRQIHGLRLSDQRLATIGSDLLLDDIRLDSSPPGPGEASLALRDNSDNVVARIVWTAPRPGASILRRVAPPLGVALAIVTVIGLVSSRSAVRAASRLEAALTAAKAADRSKTEFLSNVSHELRTPMNGILGVAQLLRTTDLDAEQRELLEILFSSANNQMALISDLLDLSRIESGNRSLSRAPFEPALILRDVAEMIRVTAAKKDIAFEADCDEIAGSTLLGDGRAFRQIITNLLGNAVKFTDAGGVSLRAGVSRDGEDMRLTVSVSDSGRGIPAEALPRIFERFYQVDGTATRLAEGTGLGLAISQSLARMMGGRIDVESTCGVGSTFTFAAPFPVASMAEGDLDAA